MKFTNNYPINWLTIIVFLFLLQNNAFSQEKEMANNSIENLVKNITSQKSISFDFIHYGTGPLSSVFPKTKGSAIILTGKNSIPGKYQAFKLNAKTENQENSTVIEVFVSEGITYKFDHNNKQILRSPEYRNGVEMVNLQYIMPVIGLEDISKAVEDDATYEGEIKINGIDCIKINQHTNEINYSFYIGKDDNWIYKMEASKPKVWGPATITAEFNNVNWKPEISKNTFKINIPEGYKMKEYTGKFSPIGSPAPDFEILPYNGENFMLSDLKGKIVILDFWATWCGPCIKSMKHLQEIHEKYKGKVVVIGLSYQETKDPKPFIAKNGYSYTFSPENGSADLYKANLPLAVVIDQEGKLVDFYNGYFGEESDNRIDNAISQLLYKTSASVKQ